MILSFGFRLAVVGAGSTPAAVMLWLLYLGTAFIFFMVKNYLLNEITENKGATMNTKRLIASSFFEASATFLMGIGVNASSVVGTPLT